MEPSNVELNSDVIGSNGHIILSVGGGEIKGSRNGTVFIDTANGIGIDDAGDFEKILRGFSLTGQMDIDARGSIKGFRGDIPFVDYWTDTTAQQEWAGFFGVVFPERAIATGESWEETVLRKKMGTTTFEGKGIHYAVTFTRQPNVVIQGVPIAAFGLSSSFSLDNLTGSAEQSGRVNISQYSGHISGAVHFDKERGVLTDVTMNGDSILSFDAVAQGQAFTMTIQKRWDVQFNLVSERAEPVQP